MKTAESERLRVSPWTFALMLAAFFLQDFAAYYLPTKLGVMFVLALGVALLILVATDAFVGLLAMVVVLVFSDDISRMDSGHTLQSLLTVPIAGVTIGNLVVLAASAMALIVFLLRWSRGPSGKGLHAADGLVLAILAIYCAATMHGFDAARLNPRGALNDWNAPLITAGVYLFARTQTFSSGHIARLWSVLFLALGAKVVAWTIWYLLGIGIQFGTSIRVATESGRVLLVFCLIFALILQDRRIGLGRSERWLALGLAALAAFNLIADGSRGPWLMSAFGLVVLVALGNLAGKIRWIFFGVTAVPLIALAVWYVRPEAYTQIDYYWSTLQFWEEGNVARSESTMVRVYEFRNIHAQLVDHDTLFLGEGPGSRFSDAYHPIPFGLESNDYTFAEIEARQFENPHGMLQNLMLNTGYGGLVSYLSIMVGFYSIAFLAFLRARDPSTRAVALSILAFLPAIVYMSWSPKINMFVGLFLGTTGALYALSNPERSRDESPSVAATVEPVA